MSAEGATDGAAESSYVVRVQDRVDRRIAGHDGCAYASPPVPRDSALALVGLLLGADPAAVNGGGTWTRAVPGGRAHDHARISARPHPLTACARGRRVVAHWVAATSTVASALLAEQPVRGSRLGLCGRTLGS